MDIEYVHGMAPHSHVIVWLYGQTYDKGTHLWSDNVASVEKVIEEAITSPKVTVVSNSWSWYGIPGNDPDVMAVDRLLASSQRHHKTFLFASGDQGTTEGGCTRQRKVVCLPGHGLVAFPPDDPNVLTVGGTRLIASSSHGWRYKETVLADSRFSPPIPGYTGGPLSSGGGCSSYFPRPTWQHVRVKGCSHRLIPDVSANGSANPGAIIADNGTIDLGAGTSMSAPLWAGMLAVLDRYRLAHHHPDIGFVPPSIYALASKARTYRRDFHDVTHGDNAFPPGSGNGYRAGPGWDEATGWGSPDLFHLAQDWPNPSRSTPASPPRGPVSPPHRRRHRTAGPVRTLSCSARPVHFGVPRLVPGVAVPAASDLLQQPLAGRPGTIMTLAGAAIPPYSGDGGPATNAGLSGLTDLAVDAAGDLYLLQATYHVLRRVDHRTGRIATIAGKGSDGRLDLHPGRPATDSSLGDIWALAVDSQGTAFVGFSDGHRSGILRIDWATDQATIVPGSEAAYKDGTIAVDSQDNVYVTNNQTSSVDRIDHATGVLSRYAGTGQRPTAGPGSLSSLDLHDGGPATSGALSTLAGLAVDAQDNLYIADEGEGDVRRVDHVTGIITSVAGLLYNSTTSAEPGVATATTLPQPSSIALDAEGDLFIRDYTGLSRVTLATGSITRLPGAIEYGAGALGADRAGALYGIAASTETGVTIDGNAASTETVVTIDRATGGQTIVAGSPRQGAGSIDAEGLALGPSNTLTIADGFGHRVLRLEPGTGQLQTVAGTGVEGYAGDGGRATKAQLYLPVGAALDPAGNVYIADEENMAVRRVDARSGIIGSLVSGPYGDQISRRLLPHLRGQRDDVAPDALPSSQPRGAGPSSDRPTGVAVDQAGNLYMTFYTIVVRLSLSCGTITTVAGSRSDYGYQEAGGANTTLLQGPSALAADGAGNLYIDDQAGNAIRRVDRRGHITTVAGTPGTAGYGGDGGPADRAQLNNPGGIALDRTGNLYIADTGNSVVRRVDRRGRITTVAGIAGRRGFAGDSVPATSTTLDEPAGVAVDAAGNLYIGDAGNGRVRVVITPH